MIRHLCAAVEQVRSARVERRKPVDDRTEGPIRATQR